MSVDFQMMEPTWHDAGVRQPTYPGEAAAQGAASTSFYESPNREGFGESRFLAGSCSMCLPLHMTLLTLKKALKGTWSEAKRWCHC